MPINADAKSAKVSIPMPMRRSQIGTTGIVDVTESPEVALVDDDEVADGLDEDDAKVERHMPMVMQMTAMYLLVEYRFFKSNIPGEKRDKSDHGHVFTHGITFL